MSGSSAGGPSAPDDGRGRGPYDANNLSGTGTRRIPHDGPYDGGDGYQFVEPQLRDRSVRSDTYPNPNSDAVFRRRSSASYLPDDRYYRDEPPSYSRRYRSTGGRNTRSQEDLPRYRDRDGGYDSYSSDDDDDRHYESRQKSLGPVGKIQQHLTDAFSLDDHDDGTHNTQAKKWGATIAGAAVGAVGGRTAKKEHWVPAALGAIVGGMVAREAEKAYYRRKDKVGGGREDREEPYGADDGGRGGKSRSRSQGRYQ